jgi:hypothetical protein
VIVLPGVQGTAVAMVMIARSFLGVFTAVNVVVLFSRGGPPILAAPRFLVYCHLKPSEYSPM